MSTTGQKGAFGAPVIEGIDYFDPKGRKCSGFVRLVRPHRGSQKKRKIKREGDKMWKAFIEKTKKDYDREDQLKKGKKPGAFQRLRRFFRGNKRGG